MNKGEGGVKKAVCIFSPSVLLQSIHLVAKMRLTRKRGKRVSMVILLELASSYPTWSISRYLSIDYLSDQSIISVAFPSGQSIFLSRERMIELVTKLQFQDPSFHLVHHSPIRS